MSDSYVPDPDVVSRRVGDETVLVHLGRNEIFALNETGTRLWELLGDGLPLETIVTTLHQEFEVSEEQVQRETETLLVELAGRALINPAEQA